MICGNFIMQDSVAEIQGLYGPFTFHEKLLQQIWSRRDFDTASATTADGRGITILHSGRWNHHGGPDFKNARLRIGGEDVEGDVEVHLRETDWQAHQHAADPAYANVVLHVVLFPPRNACTGGAGGRAIPILTLLPILRHDLEEYAADAAIERLAEHPLTHAHKMLSALSLPELHGVLACHAEKRWRRKIHYARLRIERLGWEEACHHTALEILGYSANRSAMLAVAAAFPLKSWRERVSSAEGASCSLGREQDAPPTLEFVAEIYAMQRDNGSWASAPARPANQPLTRLRQYAAWVAARPDWPGSLRGFSLPVISAKTGAGGVAAMRRAVQFVALRKRIAASVCAGAIGGTRFDTLVTDGFLPLLAAGGGGGAQEPSGQTWQSALHLAAGGGGGAQSSAGETTLFALWKNWPVGDMPAQYPKLLRTLEVTGARDTPLHNGATQGLLGFLIEAEGR